MSEIWALPAETPLYMTKGSEFVPVCAVQPGTASVAGMNTIWPEDTTGTLADSKSRFWNVPCAWRSAWLAMRDVTKRKIERSPARVRELGIRLCRRPQQSARVPKANKLITRGSGMIDVENWMLSNITTGSIGAACSVKR